MCNKTAQSNKTPKEFIKGWYGPHVRCVRNDQPKARGALLYDVVGHDDPYTGRPHVIASGTTPMQAWWMAASMR
jgi:hypothetical protein